MLVLASFKINLDFKSTHECNLDFKKQFLHILKSALILKATLIVHRWIIFTFSSQCLSLEFWRGCEHYHLEWSSYRTISIVERVLIVWVKIFKYQCCIFSQRSRDVPWIVLQSKLCLCKWEVMSLISHAFKLTVHDFELSTWEDEDLTFNILWPWYLPVNCELNSFFRIHKSQSTSMTIIVIHASEIDEWIESVSGIRVYCIHRAVFLTKSSEDFFPHISYLHSLTVIFIWESTDNHLHLGDVRIKCLLFPLLFPFL